jgi:hypothetical protein
MPYNVIKHGGKFVVQKQDGSKQFGTHDTKEEADRQLEALYAAEKRTLGDVAGHEFHGNQFTTGGSANFNGKSADGKFEGSAKVTIVDPHSNASLVTNTDKRGRQYEGATTHIPTATVEMDRSKRGLPPLRFEAPHHTLKALEDRTLHLLGATGQVRTEMVGKVEHLVVPVVALMEGVIHAVNAETPEFVPLDMLVKSAETWNGKPVTLGHPKRNGKQCSAQDDGVIASVGLGTIRNSRVEGTKLLMEALIESAKAKRLDPDMYQRLAEGGTEEVSVGALVVTNKLPGIFGAKKYMASWVAGDGDHLAFLPGGRGACSVEMGCGTHRAAMRVCEDHLEDDVESIIDPETLRCLRDIPQSARDKMSASDFAGPHESFPISTQADVDAAAHLIGKAADPEAVKRKIIAIAKRKGLTLPAAWQSMKAAAGSMMECPTCDGEGTVGGNDCPTCDGEGEIPVSSKYAEEARVLAGARHSAKDASVIQQMHDHTMTLGAACDRGNMKMAEQHLVSIDDPNLVYIHRVKKTAVK